MKLKSNKLEVKKAKGPVPGSFFPVVGIGASAGGLDALEKFFSNLPSDTGMGFIIIQHLDPTNKGMLPEILQRFTSMKVQEVTDDQRIIENEVYVIPPNKSMSVLNSTLHLFEPVEARGLRLPVDTFFKSLADDYEENSIGVILSGMGSDGSIGLKAIKEKNGIIAVQDPANAKFGGMPSSAITSVDADIIAPAEELPEKLLRYLKNIPLADNADQKDKETISSLKKIIILLRSQTGHDFSLYKKQTIFRRIERRKNIHQIDKIETYVRYLQENPNETDILFKELLIGVTSFFRDPEFWESFKEKVLIPLIEKLPDGYILRAWVPACSTGEEAYSLAILFQEAISQHGKNKNLQLHIFATDINTDAIEKARKGSFPKNIAADITPERLSKYFVSGHDDYRINAVIREMIVFAPHNVIKDPPFTRLDILSCRNMLIYMESELQSKLMNLFAFTLNPDGILLLGLAETPGNSNHIYTQIHRNLKIYKRSPSLNSHQLISFPNSFKDNKSDLTEVRKPMKTADNLQTITENIVLQKFTPPGVLLNESGDIVYITGKTGKYLEPVAGKANLNIYAMAREGLREALTPALWEAVKSTEEIRLKNVRIGPRKNKEFVNVRIQKLEHPEAVNGMILVIFQDIPAVKESKKKNDEINISTSSQREIELELERSYEELRKTREQMQASQEELKSLNEELISTNEELQSNNEELTTAKEEMQSLNEELQTVNAELQAKIYDYIRTNDDMNNLLNSTEIATLFLDKQLNIRKYTDQVEKIIKIRESDIGRPFTDLVTTLVYPDIGKNARKVLRSLIPLETSIFTKEKNRFMVRIMPYRTLDDRIDGLVITFTKIAGDKKEDYQLNEEKKFRKKKEAPEN